jgi:hypothetical protein
MSRQHGFDIAADHMGRGVWRYSLLNGGTQ